MNSRMTGSAYEDAAIQYLEQHGFQILERNFTCKTGEIDIIAIKEQILRFIEVKYRKNCAYGSAQEAVDVKKQRKYYLTAGVYCMGYPKYRDYPMSFDVLAITGNRIDYLFNCYGVI